MTESDYKSTVIERLSYLLETGKHSDVSFSLNNGDNVKGHKILFAVSSPVFDAMLYGDMAEKGSVNIEDLDPEGFKSMTEFIYTDKLNLNSVSHAISTYEAGHKYALPNLEKISEGYINSNTKAEDFWEVVEFSKLYQTPDCEKKCTTLLREETENILKADKFLECDLSMLEKIVNEDELNITEPTLFRYIEKWAKHASKKKDVPMISLRPFLISVITKIRFLSMSPNDFISSPSRSALLTCEEKLIILANINMSNSVSLPVGFCKSNESRTSNADKVLEITSPTKKVFHWRKKEISKIQLDKKYYSLTFYYNNHPFRINLCQKIVDGVKQLALYLFCDSRKEMHDDDWSCDVNFTFKISKKNEVPETPRLQGFSRKFCESSSCYWGWNSFLKWSDFIDGGYVEEDDSVLIELSMEMKE